MNPKTVNMQAVGLCLCVAVAVLQFPCLMSHPTSGDLSYGLRSGRDAALNASYKLFTGLCAIATVTGFRGAFVLIDLTFMTS